KQDAVNKYNGKITNPMGFKQSPDKDLVGRIKQGLIDKIGGAPDSGGPAMGDPREPGAMRQTIAGALNAILPGSAEEAVIQAAMMGAGKEIGRAAGRGRG